MSGYEGDDAAAGDPAPTSNHEGSSPQGGGSSSTRSRPTLYIGTSAMTAAELSELSAGGGRVGGLSWTLPSGDDMCGVSSVGRQLDNDRVRNGEEERHEHNDIEGEARADHHEGESEEGDVEDQGGGGGDGGGEEEEESTVIHAPLSEAPSAAALAVALALSDALEGATLPASESDTEGRAFVITASNADGAELVVDPSDDGQVRDACLAALGIRAEAWAEATFVRRDWSSVMAHTKGFCYSEDEFGDDDSIFASDRTKVLRATRILSDELSPDTGFELNFSEEIVCGPVLYGGFVHGDIVGVLSMRVWT